MRMSEQSPNGVNGLSTLLVASEQVTPSWSSRCAGATPRGTWSWRSRPIRNKSVAGNTVTATPASANLGEVGMIDGGKLSDVTDRHAAAPSLRIGLAAYLIEVHPRRIDVEIQMKVDVEIEAARDLEDAGDLRQGIGVRIWATADDVGPLLAGLHQQFLGAGIVGEAFLWKGANLQIDRPLVIALEPAYGVEALEPDARIDFDMGAHAGRALDDGFLQGALRAGVNVRLGEGTLGRCYRRDRLLERALLAAASVENVGFVEVDVAFDEARDHQAAIEALFRRVSGDAVGDLDNAAARDGDVDGRLLVGPPALTQEEIEGHGVHRDADVSFC